MDAAAKLASLHLSLIQEFDRIQIAAREVRMQCLQSRRFCTIPGAQWEGPAGAQFENKPRFEFNKIHLAVIRIINEYRNNRISVDFTSKDGSDAGELADTCDGLYRADEQDSGAQEAYDNCYEEGVTGGFGAFRLRARYIDDDDDRTDHQRMSIEPIFDADSCVFFSLDGKRQDKADATKCFVLNSYTPEAYKEEFDDNPTSWPKTVTQRYFDWCTPDVVWVAEIYVVEKKSEMVHYFRGIALNDDEPNELRITEDELAQPGKLEELNATGFHEVSSKRFERRVIHKYLASGGKILEDCGIIAGRCIPIIPYYGKRWYVDGIERCMGHVHLAKDAQMLHNMLMSWLAEMAARFDIEKPILTPEQILGHATMWAEDNVKRYPYLLINSMLDVNGNPMPAGPVAYTRAPNVPPVMGALTQLAQQALEDLLGNQQAGEELQPNQSGKAVELIQQRLDMQVFIYMDNFKKTIQRGGEVWLSMSRDLLIEPGRKAKVLHESDEIGSIELLKPMIDEKTGEKYLANDMSKAKFDVVAGVGPSSSSRKAATVRSLMGMLGLTTDPEAQTVITSMIMMNLEGEGMTDVRAFFRRKLVTMGAVKPTKEEQAELDAAAQNQQPDPNSVYLQAAAKKALADEQLSTAKVGEVHAKTMATLAGIESSQQADVIALAEALTPGAPITGQAPAAPEQPATMP